MVTVTAQQKVRSFVQVNYTTQTEQVSSYTQEWNWSSKGGFAVQTNKQATATSRPTGLPWM
jgi:hypothetical protein